jgi:hypothetical protein
MINRKKFAGIALMAISGFTLSVNSNLSTASAVDTSTEVVTEELCTWYLLGAPSSIALAPAVEGTEYEGDLILVSASFTEAAIEELNVYSSGNVESGSRTTYGNCTFYSAVTRPIVTMSIADEDFTASAETGADTIMDFEAVTGNPFIVDQTSSCAAKWTATDLSLKTGALTGVVATIPLKANINDRVTGSGNDRCQADLTIKINIPGGRTPAYPGQTYIWSGPAFTTALTTNTVADPAPAP